MAALLIVGPIAGSVVGALRNASGGPDATLLVGDSRIGGVIAGLVAFALAGLMGVGAARMTNARAGMSTAGLVLAWAAWRSGEMDEILRASPSSGTLWWMAVEGLIFGTLAVGLCTIVVGVARRSADGAAPSDAGTPERISDACRQLGTTKIIAPVAVAAAVSGLLAWWLVVSEIKGQAVLGVTVAVLAGVAAGRVAAFHTPPHAFMIAIALLAIIGPSAAAVAQGGALLEATYQNRLFPIARPVPLDWIAGGMLGAPIGLAWAASLVERQVERV